MTTELFEAGDECHGMFHKWQILTIFTWQISSLIAFYPSPLLVSVLIEGNFSSMFDTEDFEYDYNFWGKNNLHNKVFIRYAK